MSGRLRCGLALALGVAAGPLLVNSAPLAAPAVNYRAHEYPVFVAVGDLSGDGRPDLAVANEVYADVSVLLGAGDGSFRRIANYPIDGDSADSVAIADLNGDGHSDLAVADLGSEADFGAVWVLLGRGDGRFQPAVDYDSGNRPGSVAVGDFNGDGHPDLAATSSAGHVMILPGAGDGSFAAAAKYPAGDAPYQVVAADLNVDGRLDLAVANYGEADADRPGNVSVLLGHGDGSFQPAASYRAHRNPTSLAVGDLNADGRPDLAVTNEESGDVSVLLGRGDGSLAAPVNYRTGNFPESVAIGDLNGDRRLDLAVANHGFLPRDAHDVTVLLGAGDGSFASAVHYRAHDNPESVAIADLNGDGRLDLAVANDRSGDVSVLLNTGFYPLRVRVSRISQARCVGVRSALHLHVLATGAPSLRAVDVLLDGRRIMHTTNTKFGVTLRGRRLRAGRHSLRVTARESEGGRVDKVTRFRTCPAGTASSR